MAPRPDRRAGGRARRSVASRSSHAVWQAPAARPDPVALLETQSATRVPELVPIRYGRMLDSPFAFLRGSAIVMAADLSTTPAAGLVVQACGDAHVANFGIFATPERRLVFDVNDFDETHPAPFEWDVKRLAASVAVVARERGFGAPAGRDAAQAVGRRYREAMATYAGMAFLDVWYSRIDVDEAMKDMRSEVPRKQLARVEKLVGKARTRTNLGALARFAEQVDGTWRIKPEPPLIVRYPQSDEVAERLAQGFAAYRASLQADRRALLARYRFVDFARKVVGVGSVGTEAFMFLLMGDRDDDPLFLQLKEADRSVLEPYTAASRFRNQGARVVTGQRLMQAASDAFLGWLKGGAPRQIDSYVRQLRDMKGSTDLDKIRRSALGGYAELCAAALARAHARTGDASAIAGYLGGSDAFDTAIARFADAYADQTERDFEALAAAAKSGRIDARSGV
jgi:uncharacterized protein (DUF2252 family)